MGGGYLLSSSNSITDYLQERNVRAMIEAVKAYRLETPRREEPLAISRLKADG